MKKQKKVAVLGGTEHGKMRMDEPLWSGIGSGAGRESMAVSNRFYKRMMGELFTSGGAMRRESGSWLTCLDWSRMKKHRSGDHGGESSISLALFTLSELIQEGWHHHHHHQHYHYYHHHHWCITLAKDLRWRLWEAMHVF